MSAFNTLPNSSVFIHQLPSCATHLVESRHRLIGTPNLQCIKIRFIAVALGRGTLRVRLVDIVPRALTAHHVVHLLAREVLALVEAALEGECVGAGGAGEDVEGGGGVAGGG